MCSHLTCLLSFIAAEGTDPMGFVVGQCVATRHADHVDDPGDTDRIPDAGTPLSTDKG